MSSKLSSVFICQQCSYQSSKWIGQCPECGAWNTFEETVATVSEKKHGKSGGIGVATIQPLSTVTHAHEFRRISTGMEECDRVLGGGIVQGSVMLIGGEPGIGKSTLLTQIVINILDNQEKDYRIIYICGEESPEQILLRIERMNGKKGTEVVWKERLLFLPSTDVDACISAIEAEHPNLVIVDSIQSMQTDDLTGTAGSIGQLKENTQRLARVAKDRHIPMFLVGHVTKEGAIAGPKVLEHIVDAVLELSGERTGFFRLLRTVKNRFGATDEVGVFQVVEQGLAEVSNPSLVFLEGSTKDVPGSAIVPVMEGTRAMLVEIQALVVESQLAMPRRVGRGISLPRIQLLAAVLQKHCGLPLGTMDIFVNVAGGFIVDEPAADLAIAMAIASSCKNVPLPNDTAYAGEIGLLGEVRNVGLLEKRVKEAKRLGYSRVISRQDAYQIARLVRSFQSVKTKKS
ncbi:MAG: DNA repair protein RadA [Candidatus Pacebacteria bacterium]|nr:DNA repair protein RadA [Candidatus Paceibacterota bacterium]